MVNKEMVDTKELAKILGVHENSLYNWAKQGMPRYKISSNQIRYDVDEVWDWLKDRGEDKDE